MGTKFDLGVSQRFLQGPAVNRGQTATLKDLPFSRPHSPQRSTGAGILAEIAEPRQLQNGRLIACPLYDEPRCGSDLTGPPKLVRNGSAESYRVPHGARGIGVSV